MATCSGRSRKFETSRHESACTIFADWTSICSVQLCVVQLCFVGLGTAEFSVGHLQPASQRKSPDRSSDADASSTNQSIELWLDLEWPAQYGESASLRARAGVAVSNQSYGEFLDGLPDGCSQCQCERRELGLGLPDVRVRATSLCTVRQGATVEEHTDDVSCCQCRRAEQRCLGDAAVAAGIRQDSVVAVPGESRSIFESAASFLRTGFGKCVLRGSHLFQNRRCYCRQHAQ